MAVPTVDNKTRTTAASSTSKTFAHTVAGADRLLIVAYYCATNGSAVSAVTYNGISLTFLVAQNTSSLSGRVELWYLVAPDTGTHDVVVTMSSVTRQGFAAISFNGVNQSTPLGTAVGNFATSTTPNVSVVGEFGDLIVDFLMYASSSGVITVDASQTQQFLDANTERYGCSTENGASTVSMDWSTTNGQRWAQIGVAIKSIPITKDVTSDAQISITHESNVTSDAQISTTLTKDVTSDAQVSQSVQANVTSDAQVTATVQRDVSSDAQINQLVQRDVSSDAQVAITHASEVSSDAQISSTGQSNVTTDAQITKQEQSEVSSDAVINQSVQREVSSDAVLQVFAGINVDFEACITRTEQANITSDAQITRLEQRDVSSDAQLSQSVFFDVLTSAAISRGAGVYYNNYLLRVARS